MRTRHHSLQQAPTPKQFLLTAAVRKMPQRGMHPRLSHALYRMLLPLLLLKAETILPVYHPLHLLLPPQNLLLSVVPNLLSVVLHL